MKIPDDIRAFYAQYHKDIGKMIDPNNYRSFSISLEPTVIVQSAIWCYHNLQEKWAKDAHPIVFDVWQKATEMQAGKLEAFILEENGQEEVSVPAARVLPEPEPRVIVKTVYETVYIPALGCP